MNSQFNCWFCGNILIKDNDHSLIHHCWKCPIHVSYTVWNNMGDMELEYVFFHKDQYAIRLAIEEWVTNKTDLIMRLSKFKVQKILSLPYYININPSNAENWIKRLRNMVIFS